MMMAAYLSLQALDDLAVNGGSQQLQQACLAGLVRTNLQMGELRLGRQLALQVGCERIKQAAVPLKLWLLAPSSLACIGCARLMCWLMMEPACYKILSKSMAPQGLSAVVLRLAAFAQRVGYIVCRIKVCELCVHHHQ
jgi:hypothetical protein